MKALVIFDSNFGNTKHIAEAIAKELGGDVKSVSDVDKADISKADLLVVGSPINAWRPSEKMGKFLESLSTGQLTGKKAAAFDTRVKLFIHGDAASKIAKKLEQAGAKIVSEPIGFIVKGREGPLADSEIEKAQKWASSMQ